MPHRTRNSDNPDLHAQKRDVKRCKKHHLTDNRKSIRLISRLAVTSKYAKKKA